MAAINASGERSGCAAGQHRKFAAVGARRGRPDATWSIGLMTDNRDHAPIMTRADAGSKGKGLVEWLLTRIVYAQTIPKSAADRQQSRQRPVGACG